MYEATRVEDRQGASIAAVLSAANDGVDGESETTTIPCGAGSVLYYQGDPADHFFEVLQGVVKLYMLTPDGRRQVTSFCFPGQFVGQGADDSYLQTAETVGDAVLRRYPRSGMDRLTIEQPELAHRLLRMTLNDLIVAQDQMLSLGRKTATERIASFFLRLAKRETKLDDERAMIHLPMARTDIADYLGLTPETVSRILGRLKSLGIIALKSANDIAILDLGLLADLAENEAAQAAN